MKKYKTLAKRNRKSPRAQCANEVCYAKIGIMAIAFAHISYHSRSKGHSAVAGAAYRAGEKLYDERTGEMHNFENRKDILHSEILLPEGADPKFYDRQTLWNEVERAETRKNSQIAKDIVVALPRELNLSQQIELTRNFANYHFVNKGIAVDYSIHHDDDGNPHAHLYTTTRRLEKNRFSTHKARDLEPPVARSAVVAPQYWGKQWRDYQNEFFRANAIDLKVDAEHYFKTRHEGRVRNQTERHYIKEENALKREATREIALNSPENLLNHLGTQFSIFSERELSRFINQYTNTTEEFQLVMLKVKAHRDFISLGLADDGRERYTTRANYVRETQLIEQAETLRAKTSHAVNTGDVKKAIKTHGLNEEQALALAYLTDKEGLATLVGRAGTGKSSYVLKAAYDVWQKAGYQVRGMAVSGIASKGLQESSGIPSAILYGMKQQILENRLQLTDKDILVMDEAGMTELSDMSVIMEAAHKAGAKLVLVGDPAQLQPVGSGAPLRAIASHTGFSELKEIMRQHDDGDRLASRALSQGRIEEGLAHYESKGSIKFNARRDETINQLIEDWQKQLTIAPLESQIILAHRNEDIEALNKRARDVLVETGFVSHASVEFETAKGKKAIAKGERILFLQNERGLGVHNGDFGTVLGVQKDKLLVKLDNGKHVDFSPQDYAHFTHGYAATVHKTQGTTLDNVFVYAGGHGWNRHLTYVALTRHRRHAALYADGETHRNLKQLKVHLGRHEFRDTLLDFPLSYAIRRGYDPDLMAGRFIHVVSRAKEKIQDSWLYITNYEAFQRNVAQRAQHKAIMPRRERARRVAYFIDRYRAHHQAWHTLINNLNTHEKLYQRAEYQPLIEERMKLQKLAHRFYQSYNRYEVALTHNHITYEKLGDMANAHIRNQVAADYINAYKHKHTLKQQALASDIYPHLKSYYSVLHYYADKANVNAKASIKHIKVAYQQGLYKSLYQAGEIDRLLLSNIKQYLDKDTKLRSQWSQIFNMEGGLANLTSQQSEQYHMQGVKRDAVANKLYQALDKNPALYAKFDIDIERLKAGHLRYRARERVKRFKNASLSQLKEIAEHIKADFKSHAPYFREFGLDIKDINLTLWQYRHRFEYAKLNLDEKVRIKKLEDYRSLQQACAKAWAKVYDSKHQTTSDDTKALKLVIASQWTVKRNALAYEIYSQAKHYQTAFEFTHINQEKLSLHAKGHERYLFVKRYLNEDRPLHRSQMAAFIRLHQKAYAPALATLDVNRKQLYKDARHHQYLAQLKTLPIEQHVPYQWLERYTEKRIETGMAWARVRQAKLLGDDTAIDKFTQEALHVTRQRNEIASRLMEKLYAHKDNVLLRQFDIDYTKLQKAANEFTNYRAVFDYRHADSLALKDSLAYEIFSHKKYYREITMQGIDLNTLHHDAQSHQRRRFAKELPEPERHHWQVLDNYQQARLKAAQVWKDIIARQKLGDSISPLEYENARELSLKRNALAYQIKESLKTYLPYFDNVGIKRLHIENHAQKYQPTIEVAKITAHKHTDEIRYFTYETVNNALRDMAQDFYTHVLGDEGKPSGYSRRYGRKGSLSVTLTGSKAGSWYSFETGTGGSPIQLLMDPSHGWGLTYKEAIEEGAKLARLSHHDTTIVHRRSQITEHAQMKVQKDETDALNKRKSNARYYYLSAIPIEGTLGERYLREVRGIQGDISECRYHPKVRDVRLDDSGKPHVSYHPAIVVAGYDENGEIISSQTISLNPTTANKVDKDHVGAVKRSRGQVKGAGALIHRGTSNEVLIAEGPETAASLIEAKPNAHIYVTLGNIRNAENLGWLAKKHQTNKFLFAVDKDLNTNNLEALKKVATKLKADHNIDCYQATPSLDSKDKYDFNDVLKEKGLSTVKTQLAKMVKIEVNERTTDIGKSKPSTYENKTQKIKDKTKTSSLEGLQAIKVLQNHKLGWDKLKDNTHTTIKWLKKYRTLALEVHEKITHRSSSETKPNEQLKSVLVQIKQHVNEIGQDTALMKTLAHENPNFAAWIRSETKHLPQQKAIEINWFDLKYQAEWQALSQNKNSNVKWAVRYYELGLGKTDKSDLARINKHISELAPEIYKDKPTWKALSDKTPNLAKSIQKIALLHDKTRDKGREH